MSSLFGDWSRVNSFLTKVANLTKSSREILEEIGNLIEIRIKQNIENQSLNLPPLTKKYAEEKARKGLDPRILIATREYVENIKVLDIKKEGNTLILFVGVPSGEKHHSGLSFAELAYYIEYGTVKSPARPAFTLTWKELREEINPIYIKKLAEELFIW